MIPAEPLRQSEVGQPKRKYLGGDGIGGVKASSRDKTGARRRGERMRRRRDDLAQGVSETSRAFVVRRHAKKFLRQLA